MRKMKRGFGVFFSLALVIALVLVVILPVSLAEPDEVKEKEPNRATYFAGQIAYALDSTGASEAGSSEKGGAHYIGKGTTYTMTGGTITGKSKMYGGAVFVDSDATFIMSGGTITACKAKYGGAIYVANGGTCRIEGGTITKNQAEVAPAIYVEEGGTLEVGENAAVFDNKAVIWLPISETKENVGGVNSGLELYTLEFGSYPQTYVGNSMREELENWFSAESPALVKTYVTGDGTQWNAYEYHGDLYARGTETKFDSDSVFKDKTSPKTGRISWFKVEPIKWYILNFDEWKTGSEKAELLCTEILASKTPFNSSNSKGNDWGTSDIRLWCNNIFYNEAFNTYQKSFIETTTLKNCKTGEYDKDPSIWTGEDTEDKIYFKSYYELYDSNGLFTNNHNKRLCSGTDFAIGNNLVCSPGTSNATNYGVKGGAYWLRSAGSAASFACCVNLNGTLAAGTALCMTASYGVRPALRLAV